MMQSLVPPSIVELSSNKVVLSWRATLGQCSIRTAVSEGSPDNLEWANLEEDTKRHTARKKHDATRGVAEPAVKASAVEVLEVDHIELQTSTGCPRCIRGDDDGDEEEEEQEGEVMGEHRCGGLVGCWRPVYEGPDSRCQVNLGRGNAIHYFRLLVRATLPPPTQRGYMRPKHARLASTEAGTSWDNNGSGTFGVMPSPDRPSTSRRRRRQRNQHQPEEVAIASCSVSNEPPPTGNSREVARTPCRERGGVAAPATTPSGERTETSAGGCVQWFASDSVFVDSRPPPVTLHGIGTALVLTWPSYAGLSGAEQVSYILEQWSHAANPSTSPPSWGTRHADAAAANGGNSGLEDNCKFDQNSSPLEPRSQPCRRHRRRRRRGHYNNHLAPPKKIDTKEVFSVGTRCWFMPIRLQTGRCYWYRLGLIHEGGRSVGGPWVSHSTCVAPPRCVDVGPRDLVLSFPRAIGNSTAWSALPRISNDERRRKAARRQTGAIDESSSNSADDKKFQQRGQTSATMGKDETECLTARRELETQTTGGGITGFRGTDVDGEAMEGRLEAEQVEGGKGREEKEQNKCGEQLETPMVLYTLEGLANGSVWNVLYRGPAPEVKIEVRGVQACATEHVVVCRM